MANNKERIDKLEKFVSMDPDNPILLKDLMREYQAAGNHPKALAIAVKVESLEGQSPQLLNAIGTSYIGMGQWASAITALNNAVTLDPTGSPLWYNLGYAELGANDLTSAKEHFTRAVQLDEHQATYFHQLALTCDALGDEDSARQWSKRAIETDQHFIDAGIFLAYLELESGNTSAARAELERLMTVDPNHSDVRALKSQFEIMDMNVESALSTLQSLISEGESDLEIQMTLANVLITLQRNDEAAQLLDDLCATFPNDTQPILMRGWFDLLLDAPSQAGTVFNQALDLDPQCVDAMTGLALVNIAQGNMIFAKDICDKAMSIDPTHPILKAISPLVSGDSKETMDYAAAAQKQINQSLSAIDQNELEAMKTRFANLPLGKLLIKKLRKHSNIRLS